MRKIEWAIVVGGFLAAHSAATLAQDREGDEYRGSPPTSDIRLQGIGSDTSPFSEDRDKAPEATEDKGTQPPAAPAQEKSQAGEESAHAPDNNPAKPPAAEGAGQ